MVEEKGSTWPLRVLRSCYLLLRSIGSPTTELLVARVLQNLALSEAGGDVNPWLNAYWGPGASKLLGTVSPVRIVLERSSAEVAHGPLVEESPSPHWQ